MDQGDVRTAQDNAGFGMLVANKAGNLDGGWNLRRGGG